MKRVSYRIAAYTVLYIIVIFGIFVIQFTKGKNFSFSIGSLTVSGRQERTETGETLPLLPIHIVFNGLDFYITEQYPIYTLPNEKEGNADTRGNQTLQSGAFPLKVLAYEKLEKGFVIRCSDSVVLSFFSEKRGDVDAVVIEASLPDIIDKVLLPWKITQSARIERHDGKFFIRSGKKQYTFIGRFGLNDDRQDGISQSEIPHLMLNRTKPVAYYQTYLPFRGFDIHSVPAMLQASPETYAKTIQGFSAAALNAGKLALASKKITEKMLAAYLAEMGRTDKLTEALEKAPPQTLAKNMRTYLTNPFYANVQQTQAGLAAANSKKREFYLGLLAAHSPELFEQEDLIPFLNDNGTPQSMDELLAFIASADVQTLTARQAAGIIALWNDCCSYFPEKKNVFTKILPLCEQKITASFMMIDEGLYFSNDGQYIDCTETLAAADILMRYGSGQDTLWQPIARMLVTSLLRSSGETASLPAGFTVTGDKTTSDLGLIADDSRILDASILYPLVLPRNSCYPHAQSLALQAERGIWAWSCAQEIEVLENTARTLVLRIRFPENGAHYMTLYGIRPFYRIEIHDIPFRSDPRFELYNSSGYQYDASARILYLKIKHKTEYETVRLSFGPVPQPVRVTAPPEEKAPESTSAVPKEAPASSPPAQPSEQEPAASTEPSSEEDE